MNAPERVVIGAPFSEARGELVSARPSPREGRFAEKRKRFSFKQIAAALKQAEVGVPEVELCRPTAPNQV